MKKTFTLFLFLLVSIVAQAQIQQLQKLGQLSFGTSCAGVWHYVDSVGNEYALLGNGDGLVIVDVTDPVTPTALFTVPAAASLWREVKTYGHFAYAGTEGGGGITVIDLSGLPNSYLAQQYTGDGAIAGQLDNSHTVQVSGEYLYIFGSNLGTVMCSLADPWNPTYVGSYNANYVHDGYVLNDTLYSSEIYAGQFSVVDVTDKANPVVLQTQATPGAFNHNGWFSDNHQYFYTTDELNNTPVGVFDVSDLQNITLVATYYNDTMPDKEIHNVRVINDYIICPSYGSQLTIVDGARPENLVEIARYHTGNYLCWDASPYLPSGNIIATDMDGEFYVFAPYYVRACYLEGNVTDQSTGNPLSGVTVKILSAQKETQTINNGDYKTGFPTAGTYDVEFSKPGYVTEVVNGVVLTNGNLTVLDAQLDPFSITVNVVDNISGTGIPFTKVKFQNATTDLEVATDGNGTVVLSTVASGAYEITAGKWGYHSDCINVSVGLLGVYTITLEAGIYDDFTFDFGWNASGNAVSGLWVREEPVGTIFSTTQANPETDASADCSDRCYMTGNGGGGANNDDVDDGFVVLTSPIMDLTGYIDPYLHYDRWFYEQFTSNPAANDTFTVVIMNGTTSAEVDIVTGPSSTNSTWLHHSLRMLDYISITPTMSVNYSTSDKTGSGNPLEVAIDRFEITEGPSAVQNLSQSAIEISVYPNPFNEQFEVQLNSTAFTGIADIQVSDISGREIANYSFESAEKATISTGSWSKGVYILKVSSGEGTIGYRKINKL